MPHFVTVDLDYINDRASMYISLVPDEDVNFYSLKEYLLKLDHTQTVHEQVTK